MDKVRDKVLGEVGDCLSQLCVLFPRPVAGVVALVAEVQNGPHTRKCPDDKGMALQPVVGAVVGRASRTQRHRRCF